MKGRTWNKVVWGVKFLNDPRYAPGYIATGCTHPGDGRPVQYDEDLARYDSNGKDRILMRKLVVCTETDFGWEEQ